LSDRQRLNLAYSDTLDGLAGGLRATLLALWDALGAYDDAAINAYREQAAPLMEGAALATVDMTTAYLEQLGIETVEVSPLIAADAAARVHDPWDRLAANLGREMPFDEALAGARSQVDSTATDTVYRSARVGMAQAAPGVTQWRRQLHPEQSKTGCCQWCMKLTTAVFYSAGDAIFGHNRCKCMPQPAGLAVKPNAKARADQGFDANAERLYNKRNARTRLRKSVTTAERRKSEALKELRRERDPQRRDRLETRAQEWETRAEAAAERLRILETGTHILPT